VARRSAPREGAGWQFHGIHRPTYTQIPDDYLDDVMAELSGAEWKVLCYIARRTFGFKRHSDQISLSQICSGIRRRDGSVLDKGTGLSRPSVIAGLKRLVALGIIEEAHRSSVEYGQEANTYTVVFADDDPWPSVHRPPQANDLPGRERDLIGRAENDSGRTPGLPGRSNGRPGRESRATSQATDRTGGRQLPEPAPGMPVDRQETDQQKGLQERELSNSSKDPNAEELAASTVNGPAKVGRPLYSAYVAELAKDLSDKFHDEDHAASNRTRALRLWARSGLDEQTFAALMQEARMVTHRRGDIQRDADGEHPQGTKNRMPYFFAVLEDLIAMQQESEAPE
jgi:hypothetical protein